jgi:hypothetical protein
MPGLFGAFNCDKSYYEALKARFSSLFGSCECKEFHSGILGGHAFCDSALLRGGDGCYFAVDGERSIYRYASRTADGDATALFKIENGKLETTALCKGNVAVFDEASHTLFLATEWLGIFPLYYTRVGDGIMFCSHCRPLAAITAASRDDIGVVEYLLFGYPIRQRTAFQGIHRLLGGQVLRYSVKDKLFSIEETSRYWSGTLDTRSPELDIGHIWQAFVTACSRCVDGDETHGVMLSAGWDSRLVLAGLLKILPPSQIRSLTYGDPKSREIRLAGRIAQSAGVKSSVMPLEGHLSDLGEIRSIFRLCETAMYPYWHRGAQRVTSEGVSCVSSGVLGEILGRGYGASAFDSALGRVKHLASDFLLPTRQRWLSSLEQFRDVISPVRAAFANKPWYIKKDFWRSLRSLDETVAEDLDAELKRYWQRGVLTADQLREVFMVEHRGAQLICKQILSCRAMMDIAIPTADRDFVMLASQIPMEAKAYSRLIRQLLRAFSPKVVKFPTAAVLVPANFPVAIQESSRLVRWALDRIGSDVHFKSRGRVRPLRMEWRNFSALRNGRAFTRLLDDTGLDVLDKRATRGCIAEMASFKRKTVPEHLAHQLLRVYTMDLMLRRA